MCVFLIRKIETLIFSLLENTFEIVHLMKNNTLVGFLNHPQLRTPK